eukprot:13084534-Heterocapsa_arctica.AAC.1
MEGKQKCNIGASSVSLKLCGKEIEQAIVDDPSFLHRLADVCSGLRQMSDVLCRLQLANHPAVAAALQNNGQPDFMRFFQSHSHHPLVERIIYRQGAQSQFRDLLEFT